MGTAWMWCVQVLRAEVAGCLEWGLWIEAAGMGQGPGLP